MSQGQRCALLLCALTIAFVGCGDDGSSSAPPGITVTPTLGLVTTEAGGTATFTVVLASEPTANVTIPVTSSAPAEATAAPAALTFTPENWDAPQTVTVTGVDDDIADGPFNYNIVLAAATSADERYQGVNGNDVSGMNSDDDRTGITVTPVSGLMVDEGGQTATFTIVLDSQPRANVTVGLTSSDTGEATVVPPGVMFTPANWNAAQTITVTGVDDNLPDGSQPVTIVTEPSASGDNGYMLIDPADVSVSNVDDDTPGVFVSKTALALTEAAAGRSDSFLVRLLAEPTADVTIAMTATADVTLAPASITLTGGTGGNWRTGVTVTVTAVDDRFFEGPESASLVFGATQSSDAKYAATFTPTAIALTITDDDTAGITVTTTPNPLALLEAGATSGTIRIALRSQPLSDVTITVPNPASSDLTFSRTSLTFDASNWEAGETILVTAIDDTQTETAESFSTTPTSASGDAAYQGRSIPAIGIGVTDNDAPPVITNSAGTITFTEDDPATIIGGGIAVTDSDSATLTGATVVITSGFVAGQDQLLCSSSGGVTCASSGTGTLTLTGNAPVTDYEFVLRRVSYLNTSQAPTTTARVMTFNVQDANHPATTPATQQLAIVAVNDVPVGAPPTRNYFINEGAAAITIGDAITLTDVDGTTLDHVTVTILGPTDGSNETLACTPALGITCAGSPSVTGTLTLSGVASLAAYQTVLANLTYRNTSTNPTVTRDVVLRACDSAGAAGCSSNIFRTIQITRTPTAPVLAPGPGTTAFTEQMAAVTFAPALTVFDDDSPIASATVQVVSARATDALAFATLPAGFAPAEITGQGTTTIVVTRSTTAANFESLLRQLTFVNTSDDPRASRAITIQVTDDTGLASNTVTRTITISEVNDPPAHQTIPNQTVATGNTLAFTAANGNAIVLDDPDDQGSAITVTIAFSTGSFRSSTCNPCANPWIITGTESALQSDVASIVFTPSGGASSQLSVTYADNGATGSGGINRITDIIPITVTP